MALLIPAYSLFYTMLGDTTNKGPLPSDWSCTIESGHTSPWAIYRTPAQVFAEERSIRCLPDQASTLSSREAVSDFTAGVSLNLATSLS